MRIAIVHYHLQYGGVTRIICHQQNALQARGLSTVVLTGRPPLFDFPGAFRVIPGLQYEATRPAVSPLELAAQMQAAAVEALGGAPEVWHIHNHSLGKSLVLPAALLALAEQGARLLLQIHDFAEDGRPGNYRRMLAEMAGGNKRALSRLLYPQADHLHYAVLSRRDSQYLQDAGLDWDHLHLLPNPIDLGQVAEKETTASMAAAPLWLYPTRAIRRKNIGEFLLWSALAPAGTRFAITSGPENPAEQARYTRWKQMARELGLPVEFEAVGREGRSFIDLLRLASGVATTSVAEGFGMAFLEPWVVGTPVCGRNLPEVTTGFRQEGIILPWSYDRLNIPETWLGLDRLTIAARAGLKRNLAAYGRRPSPGDLERLLAAWIRDGLVDFGRLDEPMQEVILQRLAHSPGQAVEIGPAALPNPQDLYSMVENNRCLLRSQHNLTRYGVTVEQMYRRVTASATTPLDSLNGEVLLDRFLAPERLSLLRVD
jgi:glycosyltransferase involved in cell wall biosynthesis